MKYYNVEDLFNDGINAVEEILGEGYHRHRFGSSCGCGETSGLPVYENRNDDGMVVSIEVPGISQDKIDIDFKDDVLTVTAHYEEDDLRKKGDYKFSRLYKKVDAEKISATMKDGLINITLPDTEETKARKIEINV